MLTQDQVNEFWERGFLHIPNVFSAEETAELSDEMNRMMAEWANETAGWSGDWRKVYMDEETEKKSKLVAMHDLYFYSAAWCRAVTHPNVVDSITGLLGRDVELHHSTMHVKMPSTGVPFPMHQDQPFYEHTDNRYIDVLVHLDDTSPENGEIRFLEGSHKQGALEHVRKDSEGNVCTPHLPPDQYRLEDTVPVPAKAGDLVLFNIFTIHGSYLNKTDKPRRMVRVGYRHPENEQFAGQSLGRPGFMVSGQRHRKEGQELFPNTGPVSQENPVGAE